MRDLTAAGFMIVPRHVLGGKGFIAPSDRLTVASIGVGEKEKVILLISMQVVKPILLFCAM